jgi:hypothetical protein
VPTDTILPGYWEDNDQADFALNSISWADYDNDGDLDLLLTHTDEPPSLLRNESAGGAWLTVVCEGTRGLHPIGTTVTVRAGGRTQRRDIAAGDSFMSTHDPRPHFGLGQATVADEVDVRWPDGTHTVLKNVPTRQFLHVRQPPL